MRERDPKGRPADKGPGNTDGAGGYAERGPAAATHRDVAKGTAASRRPDPNVRRRNAAIGARATATRRANASMT